jgi:hypothetical protein
MFAKSLAELELSDNNKIGYTYKCLGAGFWAFRQDDFRKAMTTLVMEVCKILAYSKRPEGCLL